MIPHPTQDFDPVIDNIPRLAQTGALLVPDVLTTLVPSLPEGWTVLLEIALYVPGDWFFRLQDDGDEVPGPSNQWISLPGTNIHSYLTVRAAAGDITVSYILEGK